MSLNDLEDRLDQRFRILTGGLRTALPRQRTLQALIDWSFDLLSESEQIVLGRLSVFAGGFDLAAAEAVANGPGVAEFEVLDAIAALVDKSLVQAEEGTDFSAIVHYRLLETIRDYSAVKLAERGEADAAAARAAHRDYYLNLAELAEPHLDGHNQIEWLDRLEREHDNLRLALSYCLNDPHPGPGLRLGTALASFWHYRGYGVEGADRLGAHLHRESAQQPTLLRGWALIGVGLLHAVNGDYRVAMDCGSEALSIARAEGDDRLLAEGQKVFSVAHYRKGDFVEALTFIDEGLILARVLGDENLMGFLLSMQGEALNQVGEDGLPSYHEALELFHRAGNRIRASTLLNNTGCFEIGAGDLAAAAAHLKEALDSAQELGDRELVSYIVGNLGLVAYLSDDDVPARDRFTQSLDIAHRNGYQSQLSYALLGVALTLTRLGESEDAATLHGFVEASLARLGEQLQAPESHLRDADHSRLRSLLGVAVFEAAYATGEGLRPEEAIGLACGSGRTR